MKRWKWGEEKNKRYTGSIWIVNAWVIEILELEKGIYNQNLIIKQIMKILLSLIKTGVKEFKRTSQEYRVINR